MSKRKAYKHDPGRKLEHPSLRSVERKNLEKWKSAHFKMIDEFEDGQDCEKMIKILDEVLTTPLKAIEGWSDPDDIGGDICESLVYLNRMACNGYKWDKSKAEQIKAATSDALFLTNQLPIKDIALAAHWTRELIRRKPAVLVEAP